MANKLLIIGFVWPEPKSSAAGSRMMQLIEVFIGKNYNITFASPCAKSDNAFDLGSIGIDVVDIELNNSGFDGFIKKLNPKIVLFDRFMIEEQFGWRVAEQCPDALRILDTEDLHCLRKGRQQALKDDKPFDISYLFNDTAKREIASIYRCDLTLIISEAEIEILTNQFKVDEDLLYYLPFMIDKISEKQQEDLPKFKERNHFIFIGNFMHEPNYNSVLYLKETIWPLIRKQLPKAELHIYGSYISQKAQQLHNEKEGFVIKGFTEGVNQAMQEVRVCLAPIRFGAGLKGKLIDAMQNGTPCITTTIGAEGIYGNKNVNGFIEDDAKEFADKAVKLFTDEPFWNKMQQNGYNVMNNRFNKSEFIQPFMNRVEALYKNMEQHRLQNFTGSMLLHHSLKSTKFMSKWIEEKNKNQNNE